MRIVGLLLVLAAAAAFADEGELTLKEGPGKDVVLAHCMTCHSVDYILMNSPFLDQKGWEAVVTKMVKVMGAPPLGPEDAAAIQNYLATRYGKQPSAPR